MLGNQHFYNRTIRKVVVAFGTVFNDIYITRRTKDGNTTKEKFKVPLSYGSKEKYITRITADPNLTKAVNAVVPRISFDMTAMSYDPSRKLPSTLRNYSANTSSTTMQAQYVPVPYNFSFSMSIYVRNTEDGAQIIEQILPFFTPDYNVTVNFISEMDQKYDMPIILDSVSNSTDYEGDMMSTRLIFWDLEFTVKGFIWPPVTNANYITQANTNLYIETQTRDTQKFTVDYANGTNYFLEGETIRNEANNITGVIRYFSNNSNGVVVADGLTKLLSAGDKIVGDVSNASFTISTLDSEPLKALIVTTTPLPNTANIDDEYGFAETITEYPDTL